MRHPLPYWAGVVLIVAMATLIVAQPVGVFWHFAHDHLADHSHDAHDSVAIHVGDADAWDHDADHGHIWTIPAAAVITARVSQPQAIAALEVLEDVSHPSPAPFPPFSPPRA